MAKKYRASISFSGLATLSVEAESAEEARELLKRLTVEDLARQGFADVSDLKIAPRQVTLSGAILGGDDGENGVVDAPIGKRPSGWMRPI
jgi:hypothetical protein